LLLVEQVRKVNSEESLIDDSATYSTTSTSYVMKNYGNITLNEDALIVFSFEARNSSSAENVYTYLRLKVGSYYVYGRKIAGIDGWVSCNGIIYLAAGTYAIEYEHLTSYSNDSAQVKNFKLGKADFNDLIGETLTSYSSQITKQVSSRTTPAGDLNEAVFVVNAFAYTSGAQTNFENVGDSLTNGVSLKVDGSQVDWTERHQDSDGKENAHAVYYGVLSVGSSHTFEIVKDNADTVVHISITACPWILCDDDFEPVSLDFPQGSTLYVTFEPLDEDPTKTVKLGKKRAISFGDSTDYYSTSSGTGILNYNYTFETVQVGEVGLYVSGKGGCISILGVDVR